MNETETIETNIPLASVTGHVLREMISQVECVVDAVTMPRSPAAYVRIYVGRGRLKLMGYDAYRLAIAETVIGDAQLASGNVLVPVAFLQSLSDQLATRGASEVEIVLSADRNAVTFHTDDEGVVATCDDVLPGSRHPRYDVVIPQSANTRAVVPATALMNAALSTLDDAKRAATRATVTDDRPAHYKTKQAWWADEYKFACYSRLVWIESGLAIMSGVEVDESTTRTVSRAPRRAVVGVGMQVLMDARYVADAVKALALAEVITIEALSESHPITLSANTAVGGHIIETRHVIMPLAKSR